MSEVFGRQGHHADSKTETFEKYLNNVQESSDDQMIIQELK